MGFPGGGSVPGEDDVEAGDVKFEGVGVPGGGLGGAVVGEGESRAAKGAVASRIWYKARGGARPTTDAAAATREWRQWQVASESAGVKS